jgi:hypothetical protein
MNGRKVARRRSGARRRRGLEGEVELGDFIDADPC